MSMSPVLQVLLNLSLGIGAVAGGIAVLAGIEALRKWCWRAEWGQMSYEPDCADCPTPEDCKAKNDCQVLRQIRHPVA